MLKNYFLLNRIILELNAALKYGKVISVFTQEKEKLVIEIKKNEEDIFVEICVNHSLPYLIYRDFYIRAKKNSLDLLPALGGRNILDCLIAEDDRILAFLLDDNSTLFFAIRGKLTNVYYRTSDTLIPFKKINESDLDMMNKDLSSKNFINYFNLPEYTDEEYKLDFDLLRARYQFLGKEIIQYSKNFKCRSYADSVKKVIQTIKNNKPVVLVSENNYEVKISFRGLITEGEDYSINEFEKVNDAIMFFLRKKDSLIETKLLKEIILKQLDKQLKKLTNRQNNLLSVVQKGNREKEFKEIANLLLINLHKIKTGMSFVELENIFSSGELITVQLDPKLTPQENVDRYFEKVKESRISFNKSTQLLESLTNEHNNMIYIRDKTINTSSFKELQQIAKALKIKMKTDKSLSESVTEKFKQYIIEGKYKVFVGKDSKSNDILTLKFAKQNDFWFHARSVPGSHVVLRVDNNKEPVPKSVLKKAASIAAYHSKAKTAGIVPVSYTLKKFVVKRKGMEPGKVSLLKEDTLLVPPEIPDGAEFIES